VEKDRKLMGKLSLELLESNSTIKTKIRNALLKETNKVLNRAANKSIRPIRNLVRNTLFDQPEVISLSGGQLAWEFGLPDGRRSIEDIIDYWVNNIIVSKKKATASGGQISAGFTISMIRSDFKDVFSLGQSSVITDKGQELPWLEWLLTFGDRAIIREYSVKLSNSPRSRSGRAIMIKDTRARWNIPVQFSGTLNDNFTTRALESIEDDIMSIIEKNLRSLV